MIISSRENAQIKQAKKLISDASERRSTGSFFLEGARLCQDAVESGLQVETCFYTAFAKEKYELQLTIVLSTANHAFEITDDVAKTLSDTKSPQGIFCVCKHIPVATSDDALQLNKRYLALEDIQDPGNLGTIIRTAEALGVSALILSSGCCDPENTKVIRASMGGVFRLPIIRIDTFEDVLLKWNEQGFKTYACVPDSKAVPITSLSFADGSICLIGNEANGLKEKTITSCSTAITIPMKGRAESLNAAVAACITMWKLMS